MAGARTSSRKLPRAKLLRALLGASAGAAALASRSAAVPCVVLSNAAAPGVCMPIVGSGSGGYVGNASSNPYGSYPECANDCFDAQCALPDPDSKALWDSCGGFVQGSQSTWLQLGGRRIDNSASYHNQRSVGIAMRTFMNRSSTPRAELFLTSKVGPFLPLGYNESLEQFSNILSVTGAGYVDLLLMRVAPPKPPTGIIWAHPSNSDSQTRSPFTDTGRAASRPTRAARPRSRKTRRAPLAAPPTRRKSAACRRGARSCRSSRAVARALSA